ncbi:hypothetical protein P4K91_27165 [Bacillus anthracis]|uniref:hypothetical protein n=1 Tax=Bacillus cereus group TaxID=86661 RepID=UPI000FE37AB0|nr:MULTISPECIES: hypothetical protein [Bacillus cereus group]MEB9908987.1 hypothetical protein [Bacillus anthracis]MEC1955694.1 hypothetical protein [Bacillus anthracis]RXG07591.1 hypothetical protein EO768_15230 [Bacillus cereus]
MKKLKVNVYTKQDEQFDRFMYMIEDMNEDLRFQFDKKTFGDDSLEESSHYSVFLLNTHFANNVWLVEQVQMLKDKGAHDQSFLFILIDRDRVKDADLILIEKDLEKSLQKFIHKPNIISMSLAGYEAYMNKDDRFIFWNEQVKEHCSIKQLNNNNEYMLIFNKFLGIDTLKQHFVLWSENKELLLENLSIPKVIGNNIPEIIIKEIEQKLGCSMAVFNKQSEFEVMSNNLGFISFVGVDTLNEAYDILSCQSNVNVIVLNPDIASLNQDIDQRLMPFFESIYEKRKFPKGVLEKDEELLILDVRGYPIPKSKVGNWNEEILRLSGLLKILNKVEEVTK